MTSLSATTTQQVGYRRWHAEFVNNCTRKRFSLGPFNVCDGRRGLILIYRMERALSDGINNINHRPCRCVDGRLVVVVVVSSMKRVLHDLIQSTVQYQFTHLFGIWCNDNCRTQRNTMPCSRIVPYSANHRICSSVAPFYTYMAVIINVPTTRS